MADRNVAKLLSRCCKNVSGRLRVSELVFDVPVDYSNPASQSLRLFARGVQRRVPGSSFDDKERQLPWIVFLQGGPGGACPQPQEVGWVGPLLDRGYQVLLLDQRGTGLSTPITAATLALHGNAAQQAEYLRLFRADNIVRDCEAVRKVLTAFYPADRQRWSVLGQSFGGFCAVTYLSKHPEGLKEVFTTGGLPPLVNKPDPVYERTYEKVQSRNKVYYSKFPEDEDRVRLIVSYLKSKTVQFPDGSSLTPERFLQLGIHFGMKGGVDLVHSIILRCINDLDIFGFLARPTLSLIESDTSADNGILYAVMHESIYCQGQASNWAAERLLPQFPGFRGAHNPDGIYFTGEMVYKHWFDSSKELGQLKEVANILASYDDWPELYDKEQLARNEVPVYSATYVEDMYVHFSYATETANTIRNCKQFITNTMYHNGLRSDSSELIGQLFALRDDTID
ncbi:putative prolyl aminopeptidase [Microsporum canis]|uniref:Proline iminopeptidase n=1 Tax=Arthroderma otae (strain ATCC MYA-4605 / CBS 113480) TaxID=554155 RepID=C5FNL7_ARTOC|nr:proline iminopeptidase [Microsporum canis CBS 113480]EEQ31720.1 proline iminopeptidase [Microsporum canis CBS 113480]